MSSTDWWARKLRGGPAPETRALPTTPVRVPRSEVHQAAPQPSAPPKSVSEALATGYVGRKTGAERTGFCPECGSGNYSGASGHMPRCFDCGFVPGRDFRNSTQGIIGDGPATPARQVESAGYQPGTIIGTVQ